MNIRPAAGARPAILAIGLIAFSISLECTAGAAWLTESGGADMAMASAGRAAFATDSTTIAANPAGMLALNGSTVSVVAMPIGLDLRFHGDGATPGSAANEQRTVPTMSLFAARQAGRWALGLGAYSNIGLGCDFGKEWSGRRAIEDAQLRSINLAPAVAYSLSDRPGIGASIGAQYADAKAGMAVSGEAIYYGPPLDLPDGQLHMTGHSWAPVANLGVVSRPTTARGSVSPGRPRPITRWTWTCAPAQSTRRSRACCSRRGPRSSTSACRSNSRSALHDRSRRQPCSRRASAGSSGRVSATPACGSPDRAGRCSKTGWTTRGMSRSGHGTASSPLDPCDRNRL